MEFKTVTDLDKWFRESMRNLLDRHKMKQISDYGFVHLAKQLDRQWEVFHYKIIRGD